MLARPQVEPPSGEALPVGEPDVIDIELPAYLARAGTGGRVRVTIEKLPVA